MNGLVHIDNQQVVTDSRSVAKHFEKQHKHVLETITKLVSGDRPKIGPMFHETKMPDSYGRQQKAYLMNRDGFSLLVMGFTGKAALEWKLKYIDAFNAMEKAIKPRDSKGAVLKNTDWVLTDEGKAYGESVAFTDPDTGHHGYRIVWNADVLELLRKALN